MRNSALLAALAVVTLVSTAAIADNAVVSGTKKVGSDMKKGAEKVGSGIKKGGQDVVKGVEKVGSGTKNVIVKGGHAVGIGKKNAGTTTNK